MKIEIKLEQEILNEELNLDVCEEVERIWPESYETYIGDGMYLDAISEC